MQALVAKKKPSRSFLTRDDEEYGYADEDTINAAEYVAGAPANDEKVLLRDTTDPDGATSVVSFKPFKRERTSKLGSGHSMDEFAEDNSNGYTDLAQFDQQTYVDDLVQIDAVSISEKLQDTLLRR